MAASREGASGDRAERLFLELIRPEPPRGCGEATGDDLRAAVALAFTHGLFLLADARIREYAPLFPAGLVDGEYEAAVRHLRRRHISHAIRYEREESAATALLEGAAVPAAILKGSALSRDLYGEPHRRTSSDIDLLVGAADLPAADAALLAAGYRRDNDLPIAFWTSRLHHAVYERPGGRLPVEIHWSFSIPGFFNLEPGRIWDGVRLEGLRGQLDRPTLITLLLMHHHLHGCTDLRALTDLVWALDRDRGSSGSERLDERIASTGLLVVAGIARLQAEKLWGPRRWPSWFRRVRMPLRAAMLARATGAALRPGRQHRESDRYLRALVHRLGLDSPRRVIAAIAKTVLPPGDSVRALAGAEPGALAGYVRYFRWRLGRRAAAAGGAGRGQR